MNLPDGELERAEMFAKMSTERVRHLMAEMKRVMRGTRFIAGLDSFGFEMAREPNQPTGPAYITFVWAGDCTDDDVRRLKAFIDAWNQDLHAGNLKVGEVVEDRLGKGDES